MKVPVSMDDGFYYDTESKDMQDQRKKRDRYWAMLYESRQEFIKLTEQVTAGYDTDPGAFFYYLKQNYGLHVETIDSKITGDYTVVDEKKYLIYLLKYSQ